LLITSLLGCGGRTPAKYAADTQALLETRSAQVKGCYDELLKAKENAQMAGNVILTFTVKSDTGDIVDVKVNPDSSAPAPLQECVAKSLAGLVLKPPDALDGKASFTYDFTVNPQPPPSPAPKTPAAPPAPAAKPAAPGAPVAPPAPGSEKGLPETPGTPAPAPQPAPQPATP